MPSTTRPHALARGDPHDLELVRELRAIPVWGATAHGEDRAALGEHVEAGPLQGEQDRVAQRKTGQADGPELDPFGSRGQGGQRDDGFDAGLGQ